MVLLTKISDPHGEVMRQKRPSPIPTCFITVPKDVDLGMARSPLLSYRAPCPVNPSPPLEKVGEVVNPVMVLFRGGQVWAFSRWR